MPSTLVWHTSWPDDPRLEAAFSRSDFDLRDLKRRPMTVYIALPPERLPACLGFLRGFVGLALNAMTAVPGKVAFFLDELGQLGRWIPSGQHHHPARLRIHLPAT